MPYSFMFLSCFKQTVYYSVDHIRILNNFNDLFELLFKTYSPTIIEIMLHQTEVCNYQLLNSLFKV